MMNDPLIQCFLQIPNGDVVTSKHEHFSIGPSLLRQAIEIYEELIGQTGIPRVNWNGYHCDFQAMVLELLELISRISSDPVQQNLAQDKADANGSTPPSRH